MNCSCPERLNCDITCVCEAGGPEHSLFSPTCTTTTWNDLNLRRRSSQAAWPGRNAIETGRDLGRRLDRDNHDDQGRAGSAKHSKLAEKRWKHLAEEERAALCCHLLPEKAVACHTSQLLARGLMNDDTLGRGVT